MSTEIEASSKTNGELAEAGFELLTSLAAAVATKDQKGFYALLPTSPADVEEALRAVGASVEFTRFVARELLRRLA